MGRTKASRISQFALFFGERTKTSEILAAPFDPKLAGALLVALLYYPEKLQSIIPARLWPYVISPAFMRALKTLLVFGVLRKANSKLSQLGLNNWKSDAKFVKSQEVVLITGGASGIGEIMARDFSSKGVKVVVMDINPPKNPFREYCVLITELLITPPNWSALNSKSIKYTILSSRCNIIIQYCCSCI
ncbi:hypothetical protein ACMFMG_003064 [Clarireedia jacksonii]